MPAVVDFPVAQSDWLQRLRAAGARDVVLLQVPLPMTEVATETANEMAGHLRRAEAHFGDGDYTACVGACRLAIDALGKTLGVQWPDCLDSFSGTAARCPDASGRTLSAPPCVTTPIPRITCPAAAHRRPTRDGKRNSP